MSSPLGSHAQPVRRSSPRRPCPSPARTGCTARSRARVPMWFCSPPPLLHGDDSLADVQPLDGRPKRAKVGGFVGHELAEQLPPPRHALQRPEQRQDHRHHHLPRLLRPLSQRSFAFGNGSPGRKPGVSGPRPSLPRSLRYEPRRIMLPPLTKPPGLCPCASLTTGPPRCSRCCRWPCSPTWGWAVLQLAVERGPRRARARVVARGVMGRSDAGASLVGDGGWGPSLRRPLGRGRRRGGGAQSGPRSSASLWSWPRSTGAKLSRRDQITYDVFLFLRRAQRQEGRFRAWLAPITNRSGFHVRFPQLPDGCRWPRSPITSATSRACARSRRTPKLTST